MPTVQKGGKRGSLRPKEENKGTQKVSNGIKGGGGPNSEQKGGIGDNQKGPTRAKKVKGKRGKLHAYRGKFFPMTVRGGRKDAPRGIGITI